jgi:hypothetical protein
MGAICTRRITLREKLYFSDGALADWTALSLLLWGTSGVGEDRARDIELQRPLAVDNDARPWLRRQYCSGSFAIFRLLLVVPS